MWDPCLNSWNIFKINLYARLPFKSFKMSSIYRGGVVKRHWAMCSIWGPITFITPWDTQKHQLIFPFSQSCFRKVQMDFYWKIDTWTRPPPGTRLFHHPLGYSKTPVNIFLFPIMFSKNSDGLLLKNTSRHLTPSPPGTRLFHYENAWAFTYLPRFSHAKVLLPKSPFAMMDSHTDLYKPMSLVVRWRRMTSWHHSTDHDSIWGHLSLKSMENTFLDLVTLTFDLIQWTWPRFYLGQLTYHFSSPYVK